MFRGGAISRDEASTHVLEACIVASIMVSAIAYVATLDAPQPADNAVQRIMEQKAHDALMIAYETPLRPGACTAGNLVSQYVVDSVNGNQELWEMKGLKHFDPNFRASLYTWNGHGYYPVYEGFEGKGHAAHDIHTQFDFTYVKPLSDFDSVSGTERLPVNVPALVQGELVKIKGEGVRTTLTLDGAINDPQLSVWSVTSHLPRDSLREGAGNVTWLDPETLDPSLVRVLKPEELGIGREKPEMMLLPLMVEPSDGSIPAGTKVTIRVPVEWNYDTTVAAGWNVSVTGSVSQGWMITATLNDTSTERKTITVQAFAPSEANRPFDAIHARLGHGSLGESSLVVQYPSAVERGLPRTLYATTPYPLPVGGSALFGVAFANGGDNVTVTRVDVTIPGGYDLDHHNAKGASLFANGAVLPVGETGAGGAWTWLSPKHLQWNGHRVVNASKATQWLLEVPITQDAKQETSIEPERSDGPTATLRFENGFNVTGTMGASTPGIFRFLVPPDDATTSEPDGYPWTLSAPGVPTDHNYTVTVHAPRASIQNTTSYRVVPDASDLVKMQNAISNSTFAVESRTVAVGSVLRANTDAESVMTRISEIGATSTTVSVEMYGPPSLGCAPTAIWNTTSSSLPLAPIRDVELTTVLGTTVPALFLVADDQNVYRLNTLGRAEWTHRLGAKGTRVGVGTFGPLDQGVFVGDEGGELARLSPELGVESWRAQVAPASWSTGSAITSLHVNDTSGRVLLANAGGAIEIRRADTGALVARHETTILNGSYIQVAWGPDGSVYGLHDTGLEWFNSTLDLQRSVSVEGKGFALTPAGLFLSTHYTSKWIDPLSFDTDDGRSIQHIARVSLTSAGDATGDGVADFVVALETLQVDVIDGATGALARSEQPILLKGGKGAGVEVPPIQVPRMWVQDHEIWMEDEPGNQGFEIEVCSKGEFSYQEARVCIAPGHPFNSRLEAVALHADAGTILLGYNVGPLPYVQRWSHDGLTDWRHTLSTTQAPLALENGAWTPGTRAAILTTTDGTLTVLDETTGTPAWSVKPTSFVGQFMLNVAVPQGGFFGTHLLVTKLGWTGPDGEPQEARLIDWFEVVDPTGNPIHRPIYRAILVVQDPSDSLGR